MVWNKEGVEFVHFSEEILKHLSVLYRHELHNSYVYSKISNFLNIEGYENLGMYYEDWASEEQEHALVVKEFCESNNICIDMSIPIDGLDIDLKIMPIIHFATVTVDIENETSDLYNELLEMGEESGNGFVKKFAYNFLEEQIEETGKASTIFDKVKNIGDNRALLQLFDNTFER